MNLILETWSQIISLRIISGNMLQHTVSSNEDNKIEIEGTVWAHNRPREMQWLVRGHNMTQVLLTYLVSHMTLVLSIYVEV